MAADVQISVKLKHHLIWNCIFYVRLSYSVIIFLSVYDSLALLVSLILPFWFIYSTRVPNFFIIFVTVYCEKRFAIYFVIMYKCDPRQKISHNQYLIQSYLLNRRTIGILYINIIHFTRLWHGKIPFCALGHLIN